MQAMLQLRFCDLLLCATAVVFVGCVSTVATVDSPVSQLPAAAMAKDSVVLEIAFVEVSAFDHEWLTTLWSELDEQSFSADTRQRLIGNGFRCGLAGEQLPQSLQAALNDEGESLIQRQSRSVRQLHLRPDSRSEIVTTSNDRSMTVLLDDGHSVSGHQFESAQAVLAIQAEQASRGRAEIRLTPELQFGDMKQKYVGKDGAFVLEAQRDQRLFGDLQMVANLVPGQTLVLTSDGPVKSLGGNFFVDAEGEQQKLLLVRLAHSQHEDLFEHSAIFE